MPALSTASATSPPSALCPAAGNKSGSGAKRMALIVGVGDYLYDRIPDLEGPPNDAKRFYELLTDKATFAFPKENVCLLLNAKATVAEVTKQLETFLINDASKNDVVVFYYAGHGSQTRDINFDEADGMDETFVLHDSRATVSGQTIRDFTDDTFNTLLAKLNKKTENITVVLDSCNSGSATRSNSGLVSRYFEPDTSADSSDTLTSESEENWVPETFPGLVTLTAAVDGTAALEKDGKGIFTDALIHVLQQWRGAPPSYRQLVYQAAPLIKAESYQIPQANGELDRTLFGARKPLFPNAWHVTEILDGELKLSGTPMPGLGRGAHLRIYDSSTQSAAGLQPQNAKALVYVEQFSGVSATAVVASLTTGANPITAGDIAILTLPSLAPMQVALHSSLIGTSVATALTNGIDKNAELKALITFSNKGEFEISRTTNGELQLKGPENRIRSRYKTAKDMLENLILHAKQRAIFNLNGETGGDLQDNQSLQVKLIPSAQQDRCAKPGQWQQAEANSLQIIPLCYRWNIQVTLDKNAPEPLNLGGVILSSDGSIYGFPADGRVERLRPGDTLTFSSRSETFQATPPIEIEDTVLVFGTHTNNTVAWHQLTQTARGSSNSLQSLVSQYVNDPGRGVRTVDETDSTHAWTRSMVTARVAVNTRFGTNAAKTTSSGINFREYTVPNFDVRPYLPDNTNHPLYSVLQQADGLSKTANSDGIRYKQHAWSQGSDAANLAVGIDCSRAIWYAFTRAGLPYNKRNDAYLATADMVTNNTAMKDEFEQCPSNDTFQLGDVLVYRDDTKGDGHVVMVIDPKERIAWGSHGWDGNSKIMPVEPDTGVEYQIIKIKKDWQKWDRSTMTLKKCWRYKAFAQLPETGTTALASPCDASQCKL